MMELPEIKVPRAGVNDVVFATGGFVAPNQPIYDLAAGVTALSWADVQEAAKQCAERNLDRGVDKVYGIPQGGCFAALLVAQELGVPVADDPFGTNTLCVDDLVDTGTTMRRYVNAVGGWLDALYRKPHSPADLAPDAFVENGWLRFPWERDEGEPTDAVVRLLEFVGEDPTRDGLVDTPRRVVKALGELTAGYRTDVEALLAVTFKEEHDELIVVRRVPFHSLCEHHMLPFHGVATVGYVPRNGIVGLSKLARVVEAYARRLQVQERMTDQIAAALEKHLRPVAVGVIVEATHTCMAMRGIQREATMVTSKLTGLLRERPDLRAEFLSIHGTTH